MKSSRDYRNAAYYIMVMLISRCGKFIMYFIPPYGNADIELW